MTVTLFTLDGTRMETNRVLEASADWQAGSPAAQFSAVLPGENWPEELVTVRWKDDSGFTLFEGYLDTAAQVLDSDGPRLEVTARSAGCYLLDNEALPQSYDSVTLDSFCQRYLDSYGIFRRGFSYRGRIPYTVPKGQSEWEALAGFVYALTGKFPYLSREGELCLLPRSGNAVQLSNTRTGGVRFLTRTLSERRSEPISKVLVRDKNGYYPTEFGDRRALELGIRRKRYLIPPTQYEDGREDAPTLLRRAMADYRRGEAELPGLVNGIFLGDRVQFDTGREWLVIRVRWKQSGSTARTHLELADPTYADLYG